MATFVKSPPSPVVCRHGVSPAKPFSRLSTVAWNHYTALHRALASFSASTPVPPLMKTKGRSSWEGHSLAGEAILGVREPEEGDYDKDGEDDVDKDRTRMREEQARRGELKEKLSQVLSNAQRLKSAHSQGPYYSLGIDFGDTRTGVAISKGFAPRPVEVVELKGQRLEARLIEIADKEGAIEFIVGLPKCSRGRENWQTNKTRCFAGRLAVLAAKRGWRVYLHDEFGTTNDALEYMIMTGSTKKSRRTQLDAYAAVALLKEYFDNSGVYAELVVPKKLELQECLCTAPTCLELDDDDFEDEDF